MIVVDPRFENTLTLLVRLTRSRRIRLEKREAHLCVTIKRLYAFAMIGSGKIFPPTRRNSGRLVE
jgi:hypothetical protein